LPRTFGLARSRFARRGVKARFPEDTAHVRPTRAREGRAERHGFGENRSVDQSVDRSIDRSTRGAAPEGTDERRAASNDRKHPSNEKNTRRALATFGSYAQPRVATT